MPAPRRRAVNTAAQGRELEWAVMSALRSGGWTPMRSAGSKGAVDVIGIPGRYVNPWVLVQCKLTNPVLPPAERSALFGMAQLSAAVPLVASRGDKGAGLRIQYRDDRAMWVIFRKLIGPGPKDWLEWTPPTNTPLDTIGS